MQNSSEKTAGHSWAPFSIRVDYEYNPTIRNFFSVSSGRWMVKKLEERRGEFNEVVKAMAGYKEQFQKISFEPENTVKPYWNQNWFPSFDGISLYSFLAMNNPESYVEIGSGNSTRFARQAITDHGLRTRIVSIDPSPRAEIDDICDEIIRQKIEDVDFNIFQSKVKSGDVLFIDNSHRSFQGSDVTIAFTEIVPSLPSGVIYGFHDIFLPFDYPSWFTEHFYNEQYLLFCYLLGGAGGDEILFPTWYISNMRHLCQPLYSIFEGTDLDIVSKGGSSFWLKKY